MDSRPGMRRRIRGNEAQSGFILVVDRGRKSGSLNLNSGKRHRSSPRSQDPPGFSEGSLEMGPSAGLTARQVKFQEDKVRGVGTVESGDDAPVASTNPSFVKGQDPRVRWDLLVVRQ
jgi:hypothetical protein